MKDTKQRRGELNHATRTEQRGNPRYPFSNGVEVSDLHGDMKVTGRTCDIAKQGCYVDTINPFAPKSVVKLRIIRDAQSFETDATVVYARQGMGMGLSFTTTDKEQLHMLESWLKELSGEKADEVDLSGPTLQFELSDDGPHLVDQEARDVLAELILVLSRKGLFTSREGNAILQRLFKKTEVVI